MQELPPPSLLQACRARETIAYRAMEGSTPGAMFCGGFMSDMTGTKATALEAHCRRTGRAYVRFDYAGHGESGGAFRDGTIGAWRDDALAVLDRVASGPQVLVGSSMGGWIVLLLALARPERVAGLVGVAAAPDFTEDLIWSSARRRRAADPRRDRRNRDALRLWRRPLSDHHGPDRGGARSPPAACSRLRLAALFTCCRACATRTYPGAPRSKSPNRLRARVSRLSW